MCKLENLCRVQIALNIVADGWMKNATLDSRLLSVKGYMGFIQKYSVVTLISLQTTFHCAALFEFDWRNWAVLNQTTGMRKVFIVKDQRNSLSFCL